MGVSMITMNHLDFKADIEIFDQMDKIEYLHVDIMDGKFVPRYGLYPEILYEAAQHTNMPFDLHLMVENVEFAIEQFSDASNIETVSFHHQTNEGNIYRIIDKIKSIDAKPIMVIDLSTNLASITDVLDSNELSGLMFMGIIPGVLKQNHRFELVLKKINHFSEYCKGLKVADNFQIDGAFNFETAFELKGSGINNFVGGSSTFLNKVDTTVSKELRRQKIERNVDHIWEILHG